MTEYPYFTVNLTYLTYADLNYTNFQLNYANFINSVDKFLRLTRNMKALAVFIRRTQTFPPSKC